MKAQVAPSSLYPGHDPLPPVVIKIGGGSEPPNSVLINVNCNQMKWDSSGQTWNEAWSTYDCQIQQLMLQDGRDSAPMLCEVSSETDLLTTLTLYFRTNEAFEIGEVQRTDGSIYLEAKSTRSFKATNFEAGLWTISETTFWSNVDKVELRQRQIDSDVDVMRFEYPVKTEYVELNIGFDRA